MEIVVALASPDPFDLVYIQRLTRRVIGYSVLLDESFYRSTFVVISYMFQFTISKSLNNDKSGKPNSVL